MFDIGWTELAIIAVVALVVIGPKDLPQVIRTVGRWSGKARKVTRDFQRNFESMAEENELVEIRKEIAEANRELAAAGKIPVDDDAPVDQPATPQTANSIADLDGGPGGPAQGESRGGNGSGRQQPSAAPAEPADPADAAADASASAAPSEADTAPQQKG